MDDHLVDWRQVLKIAPVVALFAIAIWAGHRGYWYWGRNVRAVVRQIESERDAWRSIALTLLARSGVAIPETVNPESITKALNAGVGK